MSRLRLIFWNLVSYTAHAENACSLRKRVDSTTKTDMTYCVTFCHIACTDADTFSAQHIELIFYTLMRGSSCAFHKTVIPYHVSRHVSRLAQHTYLFDINFTSSTSLSLTGSGSRLITSRIHCTDSRGLRGDGFVDPHPRTGYEPTRTVDNPIVTEQEIEHSTEESQIQLIEDKGKELKKNDPLSWPKNQSLLSPIQYSIESLATL